MFRSTDKEVSETSTNYYNIFIYTDVTVFFMRRLRRGTVVMCDEIQATAGLLSIQTVVIVAGGMTTCLFVRLVSVLC